MTLSEPMTLATDYLLTVSVSWWGWRLFSASQLSRLRAQRYFALALMAAALAAFFGGTVHGFVTILPLRVHDTLWIMALLSIGLSDLAFLCAAATALLSATPARWFCFGALIKVIVYGLWIVEYPLFRYAIYDYLPSLLVTLFLFLVFGFRRQPNAFSWLVTGLLLTFIAAAIQRSGWAIHPQLNHNDLYHLVQIVAFWFMQRGANRLLPSPA